MGIYYIYENHFATFFHYDLEIEISTGVQDRRGGSLGLCRKEIGLSMLLAQLK